ncbi:D-alanyl-D-alanine carboxypeptidase family protein [Agromyces aerolatus]|uniref:D-alanyl-D-alanine carboxypeptidase family protein n=1 Tax=Agromyces sp. LY-1074 TaxID=3074080 RepID=UPI0028558682|nr:MULTISPECIES: serine hydrolase [unclassified Agromyces]MDR5700075.1 D-alanyl-D-alanine carboxypeptidase [Agromyces sp. LY-1074]MDR5706557.1 D-alanyl-D-alanine carboxypeptidase [Agromyces sp. LY-1358]
MSHHLAPAPAAPGSSPGDGRPPADPGLARRRMYRRRRFVVFGTLAVMLALLIAGVSYVANALGAPLPAVAASSTAPAPLVQPAQQLALPGFGEYAVGAVGFEGTLAASEAQASMPIASIAKVVTALVVLEANPVPAGEGGPAIAYTDADVGIYWDMVAQNGSVAPVAAGTTLTLTQSLEAMLLPSGNNYAISIANWAFGSEAAYVEAANAWLAEHGFTETTIADASGLSLANVGTPGDLVRLGQLALDEPTLEGIVAQQAVDLPGVGRVENSNKLLGTHGVDGIKTGTTDDAANLLFSADYAVGSSTVTVVGVMLGADTHAQLREAIAALLDSVAPGFHEVSVLEAGTELASYSTVWGDAASARTTEGASVVVWNDTPVNVTVTAEPITTAEAGTRVGVATVSAGAQTIEVPLELDATIDDPGAWWRLTNPGGLSATQPAAGEPLTPSAASAASAAIAR